MSAKLTRIAWQVSRAFDLKIAGMLVAAVSTNVNAEDCYHNWSYSADYTKLDDTYHQAEYYCYYCNAKKTEKEKQTWLYEEILGQ